MSDGTIFRIALALLAFVIIVPTCLLRNITQDSSHQARAHGFVDDIGKRALKHASENGDRFPGTHFFQAWAPEFKQRGDPPDYERNLQFNRSLVGLKVSDIQEPEKTVMFFTWIDSKSMLFISFVGGNSRRVQLSTLSEYVWNPQADRDPARKEPPAASQESVKWQHPFADSG